MKSKLIKERDGFIRKIGENYRVINFLTKRENRNLSFAISEGEGSFRSHKKY